jgi:hypothetical protein
MLVPAKTTTQDEEGFVMKEYRLCRDEWIRLNGDTAGRDVSCREGILWLTQTGTPGDHLLRAGESYASDGPGRLVIGALSDSVFTVAEKKASSSLFTPVTLPQSLRWMARWADVARRRLWA